MSVPEGWRTVKLSDLFGKKDFKELQKILRKGELVKLDAFLKERDSQLMAKGVVWKFLYYRLMCELMRRSRGV